jgi:diguanylate cyclase (GGDEF)-like protein
MWPSLEPASHTPDLVVDATVRTVSTFPLLFVLLTLSAGLFALMISSRTNQRLAAQARRQATDLQMLRTRERRLRLSVHGSEDGLVHLEPVRDAAGTIVDFVVTDANARVASMFRRSPDEVEGLRTSTLASVAPETALFQSLANTINTGVAFRDEVRAHPRHVSTSWLRVRAVPVDTGLFLTLSDISERKREAARWRRASLTDELTGLLNRRAFLSLADERLKAARADGHNAVLFYLDCDSFKQINDVHGHATGDRALREIARVLRGAVRETDLVARMGGDEFSILAIDAIGACDGTIRQRIAERLDELNAQNLLPAPIGISVGHVYASASNAASLDTLLDRADADLLHHKRSRRAARSAMAAISQSTRTPKARRAAKTATASQLTGAVSAA